MHKYLRLFDDNFLNKPMFVSKSWLNRAQKNNLAPGGSAKLLLWLMTVESVVPITLRPEASTVNGVVRSIKKTRKKKILKTKYFGSKDFHFYQANPGILLLGIYNNSFCIWWWTNVLNFSICYMQCCISGSVFMSFLDPDPYSEYGSESKHANIG